MARGQLRVLWYEEGTTGLRKSRTPPLIDLTVLEDLHGGTVLLKALISCDRQQYIKRFAALARCEGQNPDHADRLLRLPKLRRFYTPEPRKPSGRLQLWCHCRLICRLNPTHSVLWSIITILPITAATLLCNSLAPIGEAPLSVYQLLNRAAL